MNKKHSLIVIIASAIIGSFIMFYASNLVLYDVGLNTYGFQELSIISSLPLFLVGLSFSLVAMYILKIQKYSHSLRKVTNIYSVVLAAYAGVGLITSILTGAMVYGTFVGPYPFAGYALVCTILNTLILAFALVTRFYLVKKLPEDTYVTTLGVKKVFKALGLGFVMFFAFNRLGAVMWAIDYGQARTFYMTWIFYLYMLVPAATVVYLALGYFGKGAKESKFTRIYILALIGVHFVFGILTIVIGATNPLFVQAVSCAMGLERLAAMPVVILLMFVGFTAYFIYLMFKGFKKNPNKEQQ